MAQATCPRCGMQQSEWLGSNREGVSKDGALYCCHGDAQNSGCVCRVANQGDSDVARGDAEADALMTPRDRNGRVLDEAEAPREATQLLSTEGRERSG